MCASVNSYKFVRHYDIISCHRITHHTTSYLAYIYNSLIRLEEHNTTNSTIWSAFKEIIWKQKFDIKKQQIYYNKTLTTHLNLSLAVKIYRIKTADYINQSKHYSCTSINLNIIWFLIILLKGSNFWISNTNKQFDFCVTILELIIIILLLNNWKKFNLIN